MVMYSPFAMELWLASKGRYGDIQSRLIGAVAGLCGLIWLHMVSSTGHCGRPISAHIVKYSPFPLELQPAYRGLCSFIWFLSLWHFGRPVRAHIIA